MVKTESHILNRIFVGQNSVTKKLVREMCEFIIDKCFIEEKGKGKTFNLDFNKIKFKFCVDKFISTKVGFLYNRDDYYFLPGLIREWEKGFLTPIFFNIEV